MADVTALVQQMQETLSQIHDTITSLDTKHHDEKLDALEAKRDSLFEQLTAAFQKEAAELEQQRIAARDEIAEKRRREDEEIASRRVREDEELKQRREAEDAEREKKLEGEKQSIEEETEAQMDEVELEAQRMLDEGHKKISELESKRREINQMIDEHMKAPLPSPPKRRRGATRSAPAQTGNSAPTEALQPVQESGSREIAPEDSKSAAEPKVDSEEPPEEKAITEEAVPEEPTSKETEQTSAQQAPSDQETPSAEIADASKAPEADAVPAESSSNETAREIQSEDTKPDSSSTEESLPKPVESSEESAGPEPTSEEKTASEPQHEAQKEPAHEEAPESSSNEPSSPKEDEPTASESQTEATGPQVASEEKAVSEPQSEPQAEQSRDLAPESSSDDPSSSKEYATQQDQPHTASADDQIDGAEEKPAADNHAGSQEEQSREVVPEASSADEPQSQQASTTGDQPHPESKDSSTPIDEETSTVTQSESQEQQSREVESDPVDIAESRRDSNESDSAKAEPSNVDHESGDRDPTQADTATDDTSAPVESNEVVDSKQDSSEDHSAKAESSTVDQEAGDRAVAPQETETSTGGHDEHQAPSESKDAADSKQDSAKVDDDMPESSTADNRAVDTPEHDQSTAELKQDLSEHQVASTESASADPVDGAIGDDTDAEATRSVEDTTSSADHTKPVATEEHTTSHSGPASEGIVKGGAAEDYLEMAADANTESAEEHSGPGKVVFDAGAHDSNTREAASSNVDEPEQSANNEESPSQHDLDKSSPEEDRDAASSDISKDNSHADDTTGAVAAESDAMSHEQEKPSHDGVDTSGQSESQDLASHEVAKESDDQARDLDSAPEKSSAKELVKEAGDGHAAETEADDVQDSTAHGPSEDQPSNASGEHDSLADKSQTGSASPEKLDGQSQQEDTNDDSREAHSEDKSDVGEAQPAADQVGLDFHDSASSAVKEDVEKPSTTESASPQHAEQTDVSSQSDSVQDASPHRPSEQRDSDAPVSRDLQDVKEQEEPEHSPSHSDLEDEHSSRDQDLSAIGRSPSPALHDGQSSPTRRSVFGAQQENDGEVLEGSGNESAPIRGSDAKESGDRQVGETSDELSGKSGNEPSLKDPAHEQDSSEADEKKADEADQKPAGPSEDLHDRGLSAESGVENPSGADAAQAESGSTKGDDDQKPHVDVEQPQGDAAAAKHELDSQQDQELHSKDVDDHVESADLPESAVSNSHDQVTAQTHEAEPAQERSISESSDKPSENKTPATLAGGDDKASKDIEEQASKPSEAEETTPSRDLGNVESDAGLGDSHPAAETSDRRPSTIITDSAQPDDDADDGLFAVPPTPREEVDQAKPAQLRNASPLRNEVDNSAHDDSASTSRDIGATENFAHRQDSQAQDQAHPATDKSDDKAARSSSPQLAEGDMSGKLESSHAHSGEHDSTSHNVKAADVEQAGDEGVAQLASSAVPNNQVIDKAVGDAPHQDEDNSSAANVHESYDADDKNVESNQGVSKDQNGSDAHEDDIGRGDQIGSSRNAPAYEDDSDYSDLDDAQGKESHGDHVAETQPQEPNYDLSMNTSGGLPPSSFTAMNDQSFGVQSAKSGDEFSPNTHQSTSQGDGANYDGDGYGSDSHDEMVTSGSSWDNIARDDHARDRLSASSPESDVQPSSGGLKASSMPKRKESVDTDAHMADTPTTVTGFDDQLHKDRTHEPTQASGNLHDENPHTIQGTDDLFDDDESDDAESDFGEAVVEQPEKVVYQASGYEDNVALGGNHSSTSLGRNSGSWGHRSAGSRSSFGSVRETTPLRPSEGIYLATSPNLVRADWAAEHEDEIRPHSRNTPHLQPSTSHDTPGISPFALRQTPAGDDSRGLANSRWSPRGGSPQTPPSATRQAAASPVTPSFAARQTSNNPFRAQPPPRQYDEAEVDPEAYMPRDVTNTPWHARNESIPASTYSQTTMSSSQQSSPIHSSLHTDRHEPVIRDSWGGRPRGDSSMSSNTDDYDPFKSDTAPVNKSSIYNPFQQRGRAESSVSAAPSNPSASASPARGSGLFNKMRSVFEQSGPATGEAAPLQRPVSGTYHAGAAPPRSPARTDEQQRYSNRPEY